jgi:hypothetical protein
MAPLVFSALLLALSIAVGKLILLRRTHAKQMLDLAQAMIAVGRLQTYIDRTSAKVPLDHPHWHILQAYGNTLPDVLRSIAAENVDLESVNEFCAHMAVNKWRCESAKVNLLKLCDQTAEPGNGQ